MATKKFKSRDRSSNRQQYEEKLQWYDFVLTKEIKDEVKKRVATGEITLQHASAIVNEGGWVKISYSVSDACWRVMVGYAPTGTFEVVGAYSFRARELQHAMGLAIWHCEEFDERHFQQDDEDDF